MTALIGHSVHNKRGLNVRGQVDRMGWRQYSSITVSLGSTLAFSCFISTGSSDFGYLFITSDLAGSVKAEDVVGSARALRCCSRLCL
jgi:hypothetical protein